MGIAMTDRELGPGERAALARQRRLRRTNSAMVAAAIAVVVCLPAVLGFIDGLTGAQRQLPNWVRPTIAGTVILIAVVGGWIQWRRHDEVVQRRAINACAVMGVMFLFGSPLFGVLRSFGVMAKPDLLWAVAIIGGIAAYLYQRRGG